MWLLRFSGTASLRSTLHTENTFLLTLEKNTERPASAGGPRNWSARGPVTRQATAPRQAEPKVDPDNAFLALGITARSAEVLAKREITEPTPIQTLCIPDALAGRDLCGKARTGSGKTLAFGIPLLEKMGKGRPRHPAAYVLVPTRELATQVMNAFAPIAATRGLRLLAVYGGVSLVPQIRAIGAGIDVVIATPGRLNDLLMRNEMSASEVRTVVIDEADQMADLGFLPQVRRIMDQVGEPRQTMLFSATLDGDIDLLVKKYQTDPVFHEAPEEEGETSVMLHRFIAVEPNDEVAVAAAIAAGPERTIFFVRTQRAVERLAIQLNREGVPAATLHGRMSQPKRERALADFSSGRARVMVATNIAARGIHVDGIDIVVHHDPPEDAKTYLHRSGRTARAGASGVVVTLVEPEMAGEVHQLRRQAGLREAVVPMNAQDPRLADLTAWEPPLEELTQPRNAATPGFRGPQRQWGPPRGGQRRNQGGQGGRRY